LKAVSRSASASHPGVAWAAVAAVEAETLLVESTAWPRAWRLAWNLAALALVSTGGDCCLPGAGCFLHRGFMSKAPATAVAAYMQPSFTRVCPNASVTEGGKICVVGSAERP
jgi:hypothetical protein